MFLGIDGPGHAARYGLAHNRVETGCAGHTVLEWIHIEITDQYSARMTHLRFLVNELER